MHLNKGKLDGDWFGASYAIKKEGIITLKYELFFKHKKGKLSYKGPNINIFSRNRENYYYDCEKSNDQPAERIFHHNNWINNYIYPEYLIK